MQALNCLLVNLCFYYSSNTHMKSVSVRHDDNSMTTQWSASLTNDLTELRLNIPLDTI